MSYGDRIRAANRRDLSQFLPFVIGARRVGSIHRSFVATLGRWPHTFALRADRVTLVAELERAGVAERSRAVADVIEQLRAEGEFGAHWWNEPFAVNAAFGEPPQLLLERAALQHFGVRGYGVHMNGFVRGDDGLDLWVARRARHKATAPGKLDHLVAGGQPAGIGLKENLIKECAEEADLPRELAERAAPVGAISYCLQVGRGLRPDVVFMYDLELPDDFVPVNADGEVEEFYRWPVARVAAAVRDGEQFKFNCSLVIIDFLIRHGVLPPEHPEYLSLQRDLRQCDNLFDDLPEEKL